MKPAEITESVWRCMSKADRQREIDRRAGPVAAVAEETPAPPPRDGWRARMNPAKLPPAGSEHAEQEKLFLWAAERVRVFKGAAPLRLLFAVPNAAKSSVAAGRWMAAEGRKPGVPDVLLPVPLSGFAGAAVEMKKHPNTPSDAQTGWLDALEATGWRCAVCYNFEQAADFLAAYIGPACER